MTEKTHVSEPLRDPKHSPGVDWMRVENLVATGPPDINGCLNGVEVWIETKLVKGNRINFERAQPSWIIKRARHGGRVFIFARHKDTFLLWCGWQDVWTVNGTALSDGGLSVDFRDAQPLLSMDKPYDWRLLMEVLFKRELPKRSAIKSAA